MIDRMLFPTIPGGCFGIRLAAREFLAEGNFFENFRGNILKSFVDEFFVDLDIVIGKGIGIFDGGLESFAAKGNKSGAKINKRVVATAAVHNEGRAPDRPGVSRVHSLIEVT